MSYLLEHTRVRPASTPAARRGTRVDECTLLNHPAFDGGACVRVFVEDTTNRRIRRRRLPSPRLKLRIADCTNDGAPRVLRRHAGGAVELALQDRNASGRSSGVP